MKHLMLGFCVFLAACAQTSFKEGMYSFRVQDYRKAFVRLKPLARQGNAQAQYAVGYMYYYGQGILEDRKKAYYWIRQSANKGNRDAFSAIRLMEQNDAKTQRVFDGLKLENYPAENLNSNPDFKN